MTSSSKPGLALEKAIEREIQQKLSGVDNSTLRSVIEETLQNKVSAEIEAALSSNPPKPVNVQKTVKDCMDAIIKSITNPQGSLSNSFSSSNYGGKGGSYGGKDSDTPTPRRPSYGGKGGGYGGK